MCCSVSGCVCQGYCDVEHELNAAVVNCVVESVDVFVTGTVVFCGELNVSVGNCVVSVYVFVGGTVMLSSGLNAQWWIVLECRRLC